MNKNKLTNLKDDLKKNQIEIMLYPSKCDGCEGEEFMACVKACETQMKKKYGSKYGAPRISIKKKAGNFFPRCATIAMKRRARTHACRVRGIGILRRAGPSLIIKNVLVAGCA